MAEDAFCYLECRAQGLKFKYQDKAIVRYRSPATMKDHLRQSSRYFQSLTELKAYFSEEVVDRELEIPWDQLFFYIAKGLIRNSGYAFMYGFLLLTSRIFSWFPTGKKGYLWKLSDSSKQLMQGGKFGGGVIIIRLS